MVKFDKSHCSLYFRKMTLAYYKKVRLISLYLPFEQLNEKYTEIVISISQCLKQQCCLRIYHHSYLLKQIAFFRSLVMYCSCLKSDVKTWVLSGSVAIESSSFALKYLPTPTEKIVIPRALNRLDMACTSSMEPPSVITTITFEARDRLLVLNSRLYARLKARPVLAPVLG